MTVQDKIDLDTAGSFLRTIDPEAPAFDFRLLDPNKAMPPKNLRGFDECVKQLVEANKAGYGVFYTVQETDGKGRGKANVIRIRALIADFDDGLPEVFPVEPSLMVQSSPGKFQAYWLIRPDCTMTFGDFERCMVGLVANYGADPNCKDVARVLRIPGFLHTKGDPVLVECDVPDNVALCDPLRLVKAYAVAAPVTKPKPPEKSDTRIAKVALGSDYTPERLVAMLGQFDCADIGGYDDWRNLVWGVKAWTNGDDDALTTLHDWCSYDRERYSKDKLDALWNEPDGGHNITSGTFFKIACEDHGAEVPWQALSRSVGPDPVELAKALRTEPSTLPAIAPPTKGEKGRRIELVNTRDLEAKEVQWLWRDKVPAGLITILAGRPGHAKSQITMDMATRMVFGVGFPDDPTPCEPQNVMVLSCEDDNSFTIKPRLEAAAAQWKAQGRQQIGEIFIINGTREYLADGTSEVTPFNLKQDVIDLVKTAREIGNVGLIVIDPISAVMQGADQNNNGDVRAALQPLVPLAQATGAAVVLVSHLKKGNEGSALDKISGSHGFVALARLVLMVAPHPEDDENDVDCRRVLSPEKINIARKGAAHEYTIEEVEIMGADGFMRAPRIRWGAQTTEVDVNQALGAASEKPAKRSDECAVWLKDYLQGSNGLAKRQVVSAGEKLGYPERTLERVAKKIGVTGLAGFKGGGAMWRLPTAH